MTFGDLGVFQIDEIDHARTTLIKRTIGRDLSGEDWVAMNNASIAISQAPPTDDLGEIGRSSAARMSVVTKNRALHDVMAITSLAGPGQVRHSPPMTTNHGDDVITTIRHGHSHSLDATSDVFSPSRNGPVHREESMTRPHEDEDSRSVRDDVTTTTRDQVEVGERDREHRRVIAIDGPAAAGKTTVARALADRLGATYLDTGLLYRAVTLAAVRAGLSMADGAGIADLANQNRFEIAPPAGPGLAEQIFLNGENVTPLLRTPEIDRVVSQVSSHPEVRAGLLPIQRKIASHNAVVMVGRDITTVVVPDAGVKIYLDASAAERARRRLIERIDQGRPGDFAEMLREIEERDYADSTREVAPLQAGEDVTLVRTDGLSITQVVDLIAQMIELAWSAQDDRTSA